MYRGQICNLEYQWIPMEKNRRKPRLVHDYMAMVVVGHPTLDPRRACSVLKKKDQQGGKKGVLFQSLNEFFGSIF